MKNLIIKLGKTKLVLIITAVAIVLAIATDALIGYVLKHDINPAEDYLRAAIIPLFIAPIISWFFLNLLFEVNTLEQKMSRLAKFDELTGLLNRRAFYYACEALHEYAARNKQNYAVLSVDLDHFKRINDNLGHYAGDVVLRSFGDISNELSRKSDKVARFGGEEFVFFLPNTNLQEAQDFANRLYKKITKTQVLAEGNAIKYTVSTGIAVNEYTDELTLRDVLKHSDKALYQAKNNGRNQIVVYQNTSV